MIERSQRLYDCITQIGEEYLEEAMDLLPQKSNTFLAFRKWGVLAASLLLVVGIGLLIPGTDIGWGGSTKGEEPACSAPAAAAPEAAVPEMMDQAADRETEDEKFVTDGSQVGINGNTVHPKAGQCVQYPDGSIGVLLSEDEARKLGIDTGECSLETPDLWLAYQDGMYRPVQQSTNIVLYSSTDGFDVLSDGEHSFVVWVSG